MNFFIFTNNVALKLSSIVRIKVLNRETLFPFPPQKSDLYLGLHLKILGASRVIT